MLCASCGSALPVEARFCPGCGTVVAGAAPGQRPAAPSPNPTPRHERRLLTVMFGDLVGFTSASDGADPEDVRARVRPFHDLVRREVAKTGGTVARVVGDGVMVVWGYPTAHEDDATRAIRAALAIRRGLADLGADMHARIGINSGAAIVAFGSADERADDAMGDAVNVAARLASSAPIDGIVVGGSTATLAGSALEAEPMEPLALKGKADLVSAYLVHGLAGAVDPTAAQPFVGRSRELAALRDACGRAELERGVVRVLITGEPGIGKSRLVAELRREQRDGGRSIWLVGRCREAAGAPVWALGEIVKSWAAIGDDDSPATALAKVDARLPRDVAERTWVRDRVAQLAGRHGLRPFGRRARLAWAAFLDAVAGDRTARSSRSKTSTGPTRSSWKFSPAPRSRPSRRPSSSSSPLGRRSSMPIRRCRSRGTPWFRLRRSRQMTAMSSSRRSRRASISHPETAPGSSLAAAGIRCSPASSCGSSPRGGGRGRRMAARCSSGNRSGGDCRSARPALARNEDSGTGCRGRRCELLARLRRCAGVHRRERPDLRRARARRPGTPRVHPAAARLDAAGRSGICVSARARAGRRLRSADPARPSASTCSRRGVARDTRRLRSGRSRGHDCRSRPPGA